VHLSIPDIQSLSVPASLLPDHIADMWPVQADLGFSLFCCGTMPTLVYVFLYEGVKAESFSLSPFPSFFLSTFFSSLFLPFLRFFSSSIILSVSTFVRPIFEAPYLHNGAR